MRPSKATTRIALGWSCLFFSQIRAAATSDCKGDVLVINDAPGAKAVARACPTVYESLLLNNSTLEQDIDLSGIRVIEGDLLDGCVDEPFLNPLSSEGSCVGLNFANKLFSITSSTLLEIQGSITLSGPTGLGHLDLPVLERVGGISLAAPRLANVSLPGLTSAGYFNLEGVDRLTYLDVSSLAFVNDTLSLNVTNLETIVHTAVFEHVSNLVIGSGQMSTIDHFTTGGASIGSLDLRPLPNLHDLHLDLAPWSGSTGANVLLTGNGNLSVVIGRPNGDMKLEAVHLSGGVKSLQRHQEARILSMTELFAIRPNNMTELALPYENIGRVFLQDQSGLKSLRNTPLALDWVNTSLLVNECPHLDLTSQFTEEEDGARVQTWWWPRYDIEVVSLAGNVTNAFFESWLEYQASLNASDDLPTIGLFVLVNTYDTTNTTIDCDPFDQLHSEGIIDPEMKLYTCYGSHNANDSTSGSNSISGNGSKNEASGRLTFKFDGPSMWAFAAMILYLLI